MTKPATLLLITLIAFTQAIHAQDVPDTNPSPSGADTKMDVSVGSLNQGVNASSDPAKIGPFDVVQRSSQEVDRLYDEMITGYRSACCPHQEMADINCPCHLMQSLMLRYLIVKGFSPESVHRLMVDGVNLKTFGETHRQAVNSLTQGYQDWLQRNDEYRQWRSQDTQRAYTERWRNQNVSEAEIRSNHFAMFATTRTKLRGEEDVTYGWSHGWSQLIEEAPRTPWLYAVLATAGIVLLGAFAFGFSVMLKRRSQDSNDQQDDETSGEKASDAKQEASSKTRRSIEDELADMDEED